MPPTLLFYKSTREVALPLPEDWSEATDKIVGERQLSHHYGGLRIGDIIGKRHTVKYWIRPDEEFIDILVSIFPRNIENFVRNMIYWTCAYHLTNAFYHIQDGENKKAQEEIDTMLNTLNFYIEKLSTGEYIVNINVELDVTTPAYTVQIKITKPLSTLLLLLLRRNK